MEAIEIVLKKIYSQKKNKKYLLIPSWMSFIMNFVIFWLFLEYRNISWNGLNILMVWAISQDFTICNLLLIGFNSIYPGSGCIGKYFCMYIVPIGTNIGLITRWNYFQLIIMEFIIIFCIYWVCFKEWWIYYNLYIQWVSTIQVST